MRFSFKDYNVDALATLHRKATIGNRRRVRRIILAKLVFVPHSFIYVTAA